VTVSYGRISFCASGSRAADASFGASGRRSESRVGGALSSAGDDYNGYDASPLASMLG
jgi:hypothetical protein